MTKSDITAAGAQMMMIANLGNYGGCCWHTDNDDGQSRGLLLVHRQ